MIKHEATGYEFDAEPYARYFDAYCDAMDCFARGDRDNAYEIMSQASLHPEIAGLSEDAQIALTSLAQTHYELAHVGFEEVANA